MSQKEVGTIVIGHVDHEHSMIARMLMHELMHQYEIGVVIVEEIPEKREEMVFPISRIPIEIVDIPFEPIFDLYERKVFSVEKPKILRTQYTMRQMYNRRVINGRHK